MNAPNPRRSGTVAVRTASLIARAVRRPLVEGLENRVLMHGGEEGVEGVLAAGWVPWVTPSSVTLNTPALGTTTTPTPTGTTTDILATASPSLTVSPIRIDVGGSGYRDAAGRTWSADQYVTGG